MKAENVEDNISQDGKYVMKMRNKMGAAILVSVALLLSACAKEKGGEGLPAEHSVVVEAGGETYIPFENFTNAVLTETTGHGKEQQVFGCGRWMRPDEVQGMPEVPYDEGMRVVAEGDVLNITYSFYNSAFEETSAFRAETLEDIQLPEMPEDYFVVLQIKTGDEKNYSNYQYFFQVSFGQSGEEIP